MRGRNWALDSRRRIKAKSTSSSELSDRDTELRQKIMDTRAERKKAQIMQADLESARRNRLTKDDFGRQTVLDLKELEKIRACTQSGTEAAKMMSENHEQTLQWSNFSNTVENDGTVEILPSINDGQSHRLRVREQLEAERAAHGGDLDLEDTYEDRHHPPRRSGAAAMTNPGARHVRPGSGLGERNATPLMNKPTNRPLDPAVDPDRPYVYKGKSNFANSYSAERSQKRQRHANFGKPAAPKTSSHKIELHNGVVKVKRAAPKPIAKASTRGFPGRSKPQAREWPPPALVDKMAEIQAHKPAAGMNGSMGSDTASETVGKKGLKTQSRPAAGTSPSSSSRSSRVPKLTATLSRLDDTAAFMAAVHAAEAAKKQKQHTEQTIVDAADKTIEIKAKIRTVPVTELTFPPPVNAAAQGDESLTDGQPSPQTFSGFSSSSNAIHVASSVSESKPDETGVVGETAADMNIGLGIAGITLEENLVDIEPVSDLPTSIEVRPSSPVNLLEDDCQDVPVKTLEPDVAVPNFLIYCGKRYICEEALSEGVKFDTGSVSLKNGYTIGSAALSPTMIGDQNLAKTIATQTTPSLSESMWAVRPSTAVTQTTPSLTNQNQNDAKVSATQTTPALSESKWAMKSPTTAIQTTPALTVEDQKVAKAPAVLTSPPLSESKWAMQSPTTVYQFVPALDMGDHTVTKAPATLTSPPLSQSKSTLQSHSTGYQATPAVTIKEQTSAKASADLTSPALSQSKFAVRFPDTGHQGTATLTKEEQALAEAPVSQTIPLLSPSKFAVRLPNTGYQATPAMNFEQQTVTKPPASQTIPSLGESQWDLRPATNQANTGKAHERVERPVIKSNVRPESPKRESRVDHSAFKPAAPPKLNSLAASNWAPGSRAALPAQGYTRTIGKKKFLTPGAGFEELKARMERENLIPGNNM